ncbi:MAG TPA: M56 family metallopeptidase, partial [Mucilaginibacter sp.]|nr:M56 family metallopeptidase [Mucilaginibacter sp.]
HINQKHSLDILFIELLKIINWFNPFIYLLQNSLKITHEYIADEHTAARENDTLSYATFLVNNAYGTGNSSITHSFFNYNLLKKRIIMLNQQRSGTSARLKYLIAVPVFAGLLCASTLAFSKDYGCIDLDPATAPTRMEMLPSLPSASVEDPQTKLLPPPPPMLTTQGYDALSYHLYKSINYRPSKTNKDGIALIGFTITSDHKITDAKIIKSAGKELDATAINAFGSYKLSVNDKAGKGVARIYFYTTNNGIFKDLKWLANYKIDILVTGKPHIYPTTAKGYDYQVYDIYRDDEHTGKFTQHINKVVIFEKDGEAKEFVPGKDNMRIAKEKYGYSLPAGYVKFPPPRLSKLIIVGGKIHSPQPKESISADSTTDVPPNTEWAIKKWGDQAKYGVKIFSGHTQITKIGKVVKPTPASNYQTSGDTTSSVLDQFYKELARNIHYPAIVRSSNTTGKVFAIFSVDDNGILQQLKIVRGISNSANAEVFRVIKASPVIKKMTGNWVVPVNFTLSYEEGSAPDLSVSLPPSEIEKKTFEYNPGNITPSDNNRKMLDEIVIRSYVKSKN